MTVNDKQIERAAAHVMGQAVEQAIRTAAPFGEGHVREAFDSWCAQTRHMAFQFQGSTTQAEPQIARVKVLLALLGYPME